MKRTAALFLGLMLLTRPASAQSFYEDNPTFTDPVNDDPSWRIVKPSSVGLDARLLEKAATSFGRKRHSFSLVVLRRGGLAFERYFHGANRRSSNNVHSASKSILGAAIGIALHEGHLRSLDQPLADFLPGARADIRLRHLLTMSAGIDWKEDETEYEIEKTPHWVDSILSLPFPDRPGEKWNYSTGLTHLLSAVIAKATAQSLAAYVRSRLFTPIGIKDERWGKDPHGVSSGGYNVYLTARELAKFGQLFLQRGEWNGRQVVPSAWVDESFRHHISPRKGSGYGLLWWQRRIGGHDVKFAWGYGGQLVYVVPSLEMVVVFTTNTSGSDPKFEGDSLLENFIFKSAK
jgi:CubicO group peptidase (beta-lactamase class C family)